MSEKQSRKQKFSAWFYGETDPFVTAMPVQEQKEHQMDQSTMQEYEKEREQRHEKVFDIAHNGKIKAFRRSYRVLGVMMCLLMISILLLAVSYLPRTGNPANPDNNEVSRVYIENGLQDTGAVNVVAGMILSYRAFDTFGETNVLFIATCCVMILLMLDEKSLHTSGLSNDRFYEPKNDLILQKIAKILVPIIFMFGIYVMLNGHISPGGGFSGGAILGAGMILYVNAFGFKKTQRFFNETVYKVVKVAALCIYGVLITYFFFMGANGLENHIPLGIPGHILSAGLILPIDVLVGLEVACTMYAFYALFRRGGL